MTKEIVKRVKENMDIHIEFDDEAISLLAKEGFDPAYGARPLRREIQSKIEDEFAEEFLRNEIKAGDSVKVGVKDDKFVFNADKADEAESTDEGTKE